MEDEAREHKAEYMRAYMRAYRAKMSDYQRTQIAKSQKEYRRRRRKKLDAAGLCERCGRRQRTATSLICDVCAQRQRELTRRRRGEGNGG